MTQPRGTLRKAAILVASLDQQSGDELLAQMRPEQATAVRTAVATLGAVSQQERLSVIDQFVRSGSQPAPQVDTGIELDSSLAKRLTSHNDPHGPSTPGSLPVDPPPFRFLHEAATESLVPFLSRERPQTVAVVLSHMPPDRASEVLIRLDAGLQVEVLRRLVDLDATSPEIIREVERELETLLSAQIHSVRRRSAGLAAVSAILAVADPSDRKDLIKNLSRKDAPLADKLEQASSSRVASSSSGPASMATAFPHREDGIHPDDPTPPTLYDTADGKPAAALGSMPHSAEPGTTRHHPVHSPPKSIDPAVSVDFEDVVQLDDQPLGEVLRAADPEVARLALAGSSNDVINRIVKQLSAREGRWLKKQLSQLGPTRLSDVEEAQQEIARLATQLAAAGTIEFLPRRFVLAA